MTFDSSQPPHRRYNPLLDEWILVSPQRTQRPWQGQHETATAERRPAYDPHCYLCPGNRRAGAGVNPNFADTFVFTNDYAALLPDPSPAGVPSTEGLLGTQPVRGTCRVICFSPRHDLTLAEMSIKEIGRVIAVWVDQSLDLGASYPWVQIFENKGAAMGCSNPHPHGQVWASDFLPELPAREHATQRRYWAEHGRALLLDYAAQEIACGTRIVEINPHWILLVPYWATWPFELLLLPRRSVRRLPDLTEEERLSLAAILRLGLIRYDNLFEASFPYSMGWHGAPTDGAAHEQWLLHAHFYPPLLRSSTVRKFMVGYELLAEPQRDLTPEQAAERLRQVPADHYRSRAGKG